MGTGELLGKPNKLWGNDVRWTSIPSRGGVEILLVASCYRNQDKLRPDGPFGRYEEFSFYYDAQSSSKIKRGFTVFNQSVLLGSDECLREREVWIQWIGDWSAPRPCLVPVSFSLSTLPHNPCLFSRGKQAASSLGSSVCSIQFQVVLLIMPLKVVPSVIG